MTKRMLVDSTHAEETRVALVDGNWLQDFDFERASKKQLKGNIYLAKVIRIEPSLQAAFVEYGGNRHGFLPFAEIHPDYYRIPMADRPHDEEDGDSGNAVAAQLTAAPLDESDEPETGEMPPEVAAEMEHPETDADHDSDPMAERAHSHDHDHEHEQDQGAEPESAPALAPFAETAPSSEFAIGADQDLGLITDFGNAAIGGEASGVIAPITVETVGGEAAEQVMEERRPRHRHHHYKIQEVIKRRQVMLIQVVKEERGNKGAALTTFLSLAGRYCVLMPNTESGGGVSRKITSHQDRRRMKEMLDQLEIPDGMAVILRTAGMEQEPAEIQRDLEYLLRQWNGIREQTLQSTAPALIYEEANLIKRAMRDLFGAGVDEVLVAGKEGYQLACDFVRTIMPDQADRVKAYEDPIPLFFRYNVEKQIDQLYSPVVQLRSGGYIVINPTEALVSIDVNSGKATRERHIESTALKTNLEAAEEVARQLRLRDLAGLIVIDFIDMEDGRNNAAVERRMKDAMRADRARLQIGRISPFGLLELSRQRLRPSLMEINFEKCAHCAGVGFVRSVDSAALSILRMIEEEGIRQGAAELVLHVPTRIALYILNQKRPDLNVIERRYNLQVLLLSDDALVPPDYKLERVRSPGAKPEPVERPEDNAKLAAFPPPLVVSEGDSSSSDNGDENGRHGRRGGRGRFGFGRGRGRDRDRNAPEQQREQQPHVHSQPIDPQQPQPAASFEPDGNFIPVEPVIDDNIGNAVPGGAAVPYEGNGGAPAAPRDGDDQRRGGRRRGRRGGRGRRSGSNFPPREGGGSEFRPPRDENYRPRQEGRDGGGGGGRNWGRNNNQDRRPRQDSFAPPVGNTIPVSIDEIDTTPRVPSSPTPAPTQRFDTPPPAPQRSYEAPAMETARPQPAPRKPISSEPYQIVDHPDDKPKGGWWKKITGQ